MDSDSVIGRFFNTIIHLVQGIGPGAEISSNLMLISFIIMIIVVFLLIGKVFLGGDRETDWTDAPSLEQLQGLSGRFERLENTINLFKTDILRTKEMEKMQLDQVRSDLDAIKSKLSIPRDTTMSGAIPIQAGGADPLTRSAPAGIDNYDPEKKSS